VLETPGANGPAFELIGKLDEPKASFDIKAPADKLAAAKSLKLSVAYVVCSESAEGLCTVKSHVWEVPLRGDGKSGARVLELQMAAK
jgi:hypothetical protein